MMKTFFIKTYGCQMNLYDEGIVREILKREGYRPAEEEEARLFLILTCAVRKHAEKRALGFLSSIQRLKRERPERKIGVLGCLAKALGEKVISFGADFVLGPDNYQKLPEMIKDSVIGVETTDSSTETYEEFPPEPKGVSAFMAIMRGCDNFCSYCIVPYCRGRERSKNFLKVLVEAQSLVEKGVKELTILGQNVLAYKDGERNFLALLKELNSLEGLVRIRFLTSHPKDLSLSLIEEIAHLIKKGKVCPEFHLPLQSGSDKILSLMGRRYTQREYREKIDYLRQLLPDCAITTDLMVGFPGEEKEDFQETLKMVKEIRFDFAYMFQYSERPFTKAKEIEPKVPEEEKKQRLSYLIQIQNQITKEKNEEMVGKVFPVLIEKIRNKEAMGKTPQGKVVVIKDGQEKIIGETYQVKIAQLEGWTPIGNLFKEGK